MKKITFRPQSREGALLYPKPEPASRYIPEWYKKTPLHVAGEKHDGIAPNGGGSNFTVKGCVPFLDAMTSGYIFTTPCDVEVSVMNDRFVMRWSVDYTPVSSHSPDQAGLMAKGSVHEPHPFKWHTAWTIKTPPGYSTMFVHPINRYDLPFRSFGGVVETDTYEVGTQFPFQITQEYDGTPFIIPEGTPIIQAIPFKRENWKGYEIKEDEELELTSFNNLRSKIARSYKEKFWVRKTYS